MGSLASHASRGPRDGLKIAQDGFLEATWAQLEPKLAPSCLEMGPSWLHVGSSWAQVGPKICPDLPQERPGGSPSAFREGPGRSRWLQELRRLSGPLQGPIFDRFLVVLEPILGRVFEHFLIFLGVNF